MQLRDMTAKLTYILRHLLFWLVYILYQAVTPGWEDTDSFNFWLPPQLIAVAIPLTIIAVYLNLYVLMPLFFHKRAYVKYTLALILLLLLSGLLTRLLTHMFVLPWEQIHNPARYQQEKKQFWIPVRILRLALETYPVIAITTFLELMQRAFQQEKNLRELEKEKFSAEIALLKAQINPHFLFNTLNNLYYLAYSKSEHTTEIIAKLSQMMRYMIYDSNHPKVLLSREIEYMKNYISLERLRLNDQIPIRFDIEGQVDEVWITPLVLITFLENAFKHGVTNTSTRSWVNVSIRLHGGVCIYTVENSKIMNAREDNGGRSGIGLQNVTRRLELSYPGKYTLQVNDQPESYAVQLNLTLS